MAFRRLVGVSKPIVNIFRDFANQRGLQVAPGQAAVLADMLQDQEMRTAALRVLERHRFFQEPQDHDVNFQEEISLKPVPVAMVLPALGALDDANPSSAGPASPPSLAGPWNLNTLMIETVQSARRFLGELTDAVVTQWREILVSVCVLCVGISLIWPSLPSLKATLGQLLNFVWHSLGLSSKPIVRIGFAQVL